MADELIALEDVKKIAKLAKLKLTDEEISFYQKKLIQVLSHMRELDQLNSNLSLSSSNSHFEKINLREDLPKRFGELEGLLKNAPQLSDSFIQLPRVLEGT